MCSLVQILFIILLCSVLTDSTRQGICWGDNIFGAVSNTPTDLNTAKYFVTGLYHNVAQYEDDSSACWGSPNPSFGQCNTPSGTSYKLETAGNEATCYIISNGKLECEGNNNSGQCNVPNDLGAVKEADMFNRHACAITQIGNRVICWGSNDYGQTIVPNNLIASSVRTGYFNTCAIREDTSEVICWGSSVLNNIPTQLGAALSIQVGKNHACAIKKSNQNVFCWGNNEKAVSVPENLGPVASLTAGEQHNCAMTLSTNSIVCWGNNNFGQIDVPAGVSSAGLKNISAGGYVTCAWGIDPTSSPTSPPSHPPTISPTTESPTKLPTDMPTLSPTDLPTVSPTAVPTTAPTAPTTLLPTSTHPTKAPTQRPTRTPTKYPTGVPSSFVECCSKDEETCADDMSFGCNFNQRRCESRRCEGTWISVYSTYSSY